MNRRASLINRGASELRFLIAGLCAAAAFTFTSQAFALTSIGPGAFTGAATTLTFESLPGDNSTFTTFGGVTFQGATESELYSDYGSALPTAATAAGLGNIGATWGCNEGTGPTCGSGFTLPSARVRVGAFLSSNVDISVQVSAFRSGVLLGSQTLVVAADVIGFVGFDDPNGIDRIVIGDNTLCPACIHQLDNVMFETPVAAVASAAVPTMSQWGVIILAGLLTLGAAVTLRGRQ